METREWMWEQNGRWHRIQLQHDPDRSFLDVLVSGQSVILRATQLPDGGVLHRFSIAGEPASITVRPGGGKYTYDFHVNRPATSSQTTLSDESIARIAASEGNSFLGEVTTGALRAAVPRILKITLAAAVMLPIVVYFYKREVAWDLYKSPEDGYEIQYPPGVGHDSDESPNFPKKGFVREHLRGVYSAGCNWEVRVTTFREEWQAEAAFNDETEYLSHQRDIIIQPRKTEDGRLSLRYLDRGENKEAGRLVCFKNRLYTVSVLSNLLPSESKQKRFLDSFKAFDPTSPGDARATAP